MHYRISVDVGGTFTDVVVTDEAGDFTIGKALTDPHARLLQHQGGARGRGRGTRPAVRGTPRWRIDVPLRDHAFDQCHSRAQDCAHRVPDDQGVSGRVVAQGGRQGRAAQCSGRIPRPYIPRRYTFEIPERVNAEGGVETPLDEVAARAILADLSRKGIEAVAVCLLWSIANPDHELRVGKLLEELLPGIPYTLSHQLNPILREYRRASSAAIDASLKPMMQQHLLNFRVRPARRRLHWRGADRAPRSAASCTCATSFSDRSTS